MHSDQAKKADKRAERHDIRRAFHPQLATAWQLSLATKHQARNDFFGLPYRGEINEIGQRIDPHWAKIKRRGLDFVPLVIRTQYFSLISQLEIQIFWRDKKHGGIFSGGDLDNRLKGLLDALTVPQDNQLPDDLSGDPNPFRCLLESDSLVNRVTIKAEPLLLPPKPDEPDAYVELTIDVHIDGDELGDAI